MSTLPLKNLAPPPQPSSVSSSYWKIPDSEAYLSSIATHETDPLIAVASGAQKSNLFIYELNKQAGEVEHETILTHHQTISLPSIHALQWASPYQTLGGYGNVLASGHNSGLAYLTLLPDPHSSDQPARILRQFNHKRHIPKNEEVRSTRIKNLSLLGKNWTCCTDSALMTLFSQNIFLWDPSRSDLPVMRKRARGIVSLHPSPLRDGIISFGGQRGVSITDIRVRDSQGLCPPNENDTMVTQVKWSPHDENLLAAVHDSDTIKLWDIRAGGPLVTLTGHGDKINSLCWSNVDDNKITSASCDGSIKIWNIRDCIEMQAQPPQMAPASSDGLDWLPHQHRKQVNRFDDIFSHMSYFLQGSRNKQPSTTIFANNKEFLALDNLSCAQSSADKFISVDSLGFFGLHTRVAAPQTTTVISDSESSISSLEDDIFSAKSSTMTSDITEPDCDKPLP